MKLYWDAMFFSVGGTYNMEGVFRLFSVTYISTVPLQMISSMATHL